VDDNQVGAMGERFWVGVRVEAARDQSGIGGLVRCQPAWSMIREKVLKAPGAFRLERLDLMPKRSQFAQDAAQKMRIAVVPTGLE
jgi:hypothetical protein